MTFGTMSVLCLYYGNKGSTPEFSFLLFILNMFQVIENMYKAQDYDNSNLSVALNMDNLF